MKDAKNQLENIAIAKNVSEKQHEMDKQEIVRRLREGQQRIIKLEENLVEALKNFKIEVEENKDAKDKLAHLEKEVLTYDRMLSDVVTMTMKLKDIGEIQVDSRDATLIGSGNFGQVYRAIHNGKEFAIKRNKNIDILSITEATVMASMSHPNIMKVTGFKISAEDLSIAMDLMDTDLDKLLDSKANDRSTEWRKKVVLDTCRSVVYIHEQKILHRDIKTENFLVKFNPTGLKVCLSDFGLAHVGLRANKFYGTRGYVAPEVYDDDSFYDSKVDDWSLGAVLYEVIVNDTLVRKTDDVEEELNPKARWERMKVDMNREARALRGLLILDPKQRKTAGDILKKLF